MSQATGETIGNLSREVFIPEVIDDEWLQSFNAEFEGLPDCSATLMAEDWLEQPWDGPVPSSEYVPMDMQSNGGWWQTIHGKVLSVACTYLPREDKAPVLALRQASVGVADSPDRPLAEGRTVLIRLDRLAGQKINVSF